MNFTLKRCQTGHCVYVTSNGEEVNIMLFNTNIEIIISTIRWWHDDVVWCRKKNIRNRIKNPNQYVDVTNCERFSYYLGMEIEYKVETGNIMTHERQYTKELLEEWAMSDCKPAMTTCLKELC